MIILKNRTYDWLKFTTTVSFPGFMVLYFIASTIWVIPEAKNVLGFCGVYLFVMGLILYNSSKNYEHDGLLRVYNEDEKTIFSLELNGDPDALEERDVVSFRVESQGKQLL